MLYLRKVPQGNKCFLCKPLIDIPVRNPIGLIKDCSIRHAVEQGPERGIAAAIVVKLEVFISEMHWDYLIAEESSSWCIITGVWLRYGVTFIHIRSRPTNPQAMTLDDNWGNSCDKTSSSSFTTENSVRVPVQSEGKSIGDQNKTGSCDCHARPLGYKNTLISN